jgi:hypothetical protein
VLTPVPQTTSPKTALLKHYQAAGTLKEESFCNGDVWRALHLSVAACRRGGELSLRRCPDHACTPRSLLPLPLLLIGGRQVQAGEFVAGVRAHAGRKTAVGPEAQHRS